MAITYELSKQRPVTISVVGVGGGGCNSVDDMISRGLSEIDFIAINTDGQALKNNIAEYKIQAGRALTHGRGTGGDPQKGFRSVEENKEEISSLLSESDLVFVTAGMGGGTGTGGAPVVASIAKANGALVVGIVTKPFAFERDRRMSIAIDGINELRKHVDTLIVVPNEKLLKLADRKTPIGESFKMANEVLYNAIRGIFSLIWNVGMMNHEFADVRAVLKNAGEALIGCGSGSGENGAIEAARSAIEHPLLEEISISGADAALVNVVGGPTFALTELDEIMTFIQERIGDEAHIIHGVSIDESMGDRKDVMVIAAGFSGRDSTKNRGTRIGTENTPPHSNDSASHMDFLGRNNRFSPDALHEQDNEPYDFSRLERTPREVIGDDIDTPTVLRRMMDKDKGTS
jgi:cell division protein FtsZ